MAVLNRNVSTLRLPTFYLSHGGGPWPWMADQFPGDLTHLTESLAAIPTQLPSKPRAVLCVTAHWVAPRFTIGRAANPPMLYDYGGFPPHTYEIVYPAPGDPELADQVADLLRAAGIDTASDETRGFDHGTFVPLYVAWPDASVPIVQLSVRAGYDPAEHLAVGQALAPLRDDGVLIVGSGLSFHNMRAFGAAGSDASQEFDTWLTDTLTASSPAIRSDRLVGWEDAPSARLAHPAEDHLIPLMVAVGAAGNDAGVRTYHQDDFMGAVSASSYRFG